MQKSVTFSWEGLLLGNRFIESTLKLYSLHSNLVVLIFSPKDFIPESLKSRVVYQFTCASCGARYIGETNRHFHTRVNEHLFRDKNSHVFKHLNCSWHCRDICDASSFKNIDFAKTFSQLKIKERFHIERLNPELNKQVEHVNLSLHF